MGKAAGNSGQLQVAIAALLVIAAVLLLVVAHDLSARMQRLAGEGLVDQAEILAKRQVDRERTDYRGRPRPGRTDYLLMLSVNTRAATTHREFVKTGAVRRSEGSLRITHELPVPKAVYERHEVGSRIAVTFLSGQLGFDKDGLQLTEVVAQQGSGGYLLALRLAALGSLLLGILLGYLSRRRGRL